MHQTAIGGLTGENRIQGVPVHIFHMENIPDLGDFASGFLGIIWFTGYIFHRFIEKSVF